MYHASPSVVTVAEDRYSNYGVEVGGYFVVGESWCGDPPFIVPPLTVEPTKPKLCRDARYLNLLLRDMPFSLDSLVDLPRYVSKDTAPTKRP